MAWTVEIELNEQFEPADDRKLMHKIGRISLYKRIIHNGNEHIPVYEVSFAGIDLPFTARIPEQALKYARRFLNETRLLEKHRPKIAGPLIAIRAWRVEIDANLGPRLSSFNGKIWPGPVFSAHEKPAMNNTSGLYCFKLSHAGELKEGGYTNDTTITGFVELLGTVCEHEWGYRAEKMVIRRLHSFREMWPPMKEALETTYCCEVIREHRTPEENLRG